MLKKVRIAEVIKKMNIFLGLMKKIGRCIVVCFHPVGKNTKKKSKIRKLGLSTRFSWNNREEKKKTKRNKEFLLRPFHFFFSSLRVVKKTLCFNPVSKDINVIRPS